METQETYVNKSIDKNILKNFTVSFYSKNPFLSSKFDKKQNIKGTMGIRIYLNTMKQAFDAIIGTGIEAKYNEVDKGDYMEVVVKIPKK